MEELEQHVSIPGKIRPENLELEPRGSESTADGAKSEIVKGPCIGWWER